MSETIDMKILGVRTPVNVPADPEDALITDYGKYIDFVKRAEEEFNQKLRDFFTFSIKDRAIEKAAREWEKAGAILAGYAGTIFNVNKDNSELREYAMELYDKITKASMLRAQNMAKHRDRIMAADPNNKTEEERLTKIKQEADSSLIRAVSTQNRFMELYEKGECYDAARHEQEARASARAAEKRKLIPEGHIHTPGRIYPPIPIPIEEQVPYAPEPYREYKTQPVEAYNFDTELDEFVLKPGYVSEDGRIDSESVIWDRKNHQVVMKFRGGEPIIWPEWKATWLGDLPAEDSWCWEYLGRLGQRMRDEEHWEMFERRPYEEDN